MAPSADVRRRVFPDRGHDVGPWRAWPAAAREALDAERRARAAVLLRFGVGGRDRAADSLGPLEVFARAQSRGGRDQAARFRRRARIRRPSVPTWPSAAHASHRSRRTGRLGLIRWPKATRA